MSERTAPSAGRSEPPLLVAGGTLVDPVARRTRRADLLVRDGVIAAIEAGISEQLPRRGASTIQRIDATGLLVAPGFVDIHVHLREPGKEEAETIETGSRGAALGGFTAIVAMPNTDPAQDSVAVVEFVREQGRRAGLCEVLPSGCITISRAGERLAPFGELGTPSVADLFVAMMQGDRT